MDFLTSDLHFNHANIISYCGRPFDNVDEMDECMIENWNSVVKPVDTVRVVGDFCWPKGEKTVEYYLSKLNGKKKLILGNHDHKPEQLAKYFDSVVQYEELKVNGVFVVLMHYPIAEWNGCYWDSLHAYGHVHGTRVHPGKSLDVGVDTHNFFPWSLDEAIEVMKAKPNTMLPDLWKHWWEEARKPENVKELYSTLGEIDWIAYQDMLVMPDDTWYGLLYDFPYTGLSYIVNHSDAAGETLVREYKTAVSAQRSWRSLMAALQAEGIDCE